MELVNLGSLPRNRGWLKLVIILKMPREAATLNTLFKKPTASVLPVQVQDFTCCLPDALFI